MRNLHYLKDIALDAFESYKAELKGDAKHENWFSPLNSYFSRIGLSACCGDYTNRDMQYSFPLSGI